MASGFGAKGGAGRCYQFWLDVQTCMKTCDHPDQCMNQKEVGRLPPSLTNSPAPGGFCVSCLFVDRQRNWHREKLPPTHTTLPDLCSCSNSLEDVHRAGGGTGGGGGARLRAWQCIETLSSAPYVGRVSADVQPRSCDLHSSPWARPPKSITRRCCAKGCPGRVPSARAP